MGPLESDDGATSQTSWTTNISGQIENSADGGRGDRRLVALAFAQAGGSYTSLGKESREGRDWDVVRVQFGDSDVYDLFIDDKSGELLGERITEDGNAHFVRYDDWHQVSGVRMPFVEHTAATNPTNDEDRKVDEIRIDPPLTADTFARPPSPRIWQFAAGRTSTGWLDFEFHNNIEIFIPAKVDGHNLSLLLDSGAGISVLDSTFAKGAGISTAGRLGLSGTGGQSTMDLAPNIEIALGGLTLRHVTAGVVDLSAVSVAAAHPMPFVLGREAFDQLVIDIDFRNRRIAFREPDNFSAPPGAVRVPIGEHEGKRTVPVSVDGAAPVPFDFDLGNDSPLIVYSAYRDRAHLMDGRPQSLELAGGVGGINTIRIASVSSIELAGVRLENVPTDFPDAANNSLTFVRTAGNIGLPVFTRFRLITDYPHDAIWLVPDSTAITEPFPRN